MNIRCLYDKLVPIHELKSHPDNRNQHSEEQIQRLAEILKYQGWRYPVKVSNQSGFISSGHGRVAAATLNKWTHVPVNFQDYDDYDQEYADVQADNAIASWAELDFSGINMDIGKLGPDFNIDMLGIKNFKIEPADKDPGCGEDEVPEHVEPKTKRGDLFILGSHRLYCGDSTVLSDVEKLMDGRTADLVFTDPPYGVSFVGIKGTMYVDGKKSGRDSSEQIQGDELRGQDLTQLFRDSISNLLTVTSDDAPFYIFFGINKSLEVLPALDDCDLQIRNWLIWDKGNVGFHAMGAQYKPNFESFLYCHKKDTSPKWRGDHNQQTIWRHSLERLGLHPTTKPVALIVQALKNHEPEIVVDLFGGSGSTMIACEQIKRACMTMELDPYYCDVIVARWEKYTGEKAELITQQ